VEVWTVDKVRSLPPGSGPTGSSVVFVGGMMQGKVKHLPTTVDDGPAPFAGYDQGRRVCHWYTLPAGVLTQGVDLRVVPGCMRRPRSGYRQTARKPGSEESSGSPGADPECGGSMGAVDTGNDRGYELARIRTSLTALQERFDGARADDGRALRERVREAVKARDAASVADCQGLISLAGAYAAVAQDLADFGLSAEAELLVEIGLGTVMEAENCLAHVA
jgi:hypothetical protein